LKLRCSGCGNDLQVIQNETGSDIYCSYSYLSYKNILLLKPGKRINVKLTLENKCWSHKGKITAITDSTLVINYKDHVKLDSVLIQDYRFNNHPIGKIILGTIEVGVFLYGTAWTFFAEIMGDGDPRGAMIFASATILADAILFKATFSKRKHLLNKWNISIKKVKRDFID